jgi:predicted membrane channel-forming protein YqfA (hemolysin III family)
MSNRTLRNWLTLIFGTIIVAALLPLVEPLSFRIFLYIVLAVSDVFAALRLLDIRLR